MLIFFTLRYKLIGILGGMGPEATADLYMRIIRILQNKGAKYDADFPPIFIYSLPLPDIVENIKCEKVIVSMLIDGIKKLEKVGASSIAISCNSVFSYFKQIQNAVSIPIINIMEETAREVNKKGFKKVGILGTKLTIKQKLFDNSLKKYNIKVIKPTINQQKIITIIIMNILSGRKLKQDKLALISIIKYLQNKGAEAVILGCTELPLILSQKDVNIKIFDTMAVLATTVIKYSTNNNYLNQNLNEIKNEPSNTKRNT